MNRKEEILAWLQAQKVPYQLVEHPAAYDMEDIAAFGVSKTGHVAKNLFLRDSARGKHHFLVTVRGEKQVDLKALGAALGQRLSFASEERLAKYLHLKKGEVTPLAVYYDEGGEVQVYLDKALAEEEKVGVHPCDNTATVFLAFEDLVKLVESRGHRVHLVQV